MRKKFSVFFARYWEDAAIVLLLLTALALSFRLYSAAIPKTGAGAAAETPAEEKTTDELLRTVSLPLSMAVCSSDGVLTGLVYDGEAISESAGRFSAMAAEAIGSASSPEDMSEEEWRNALTSCGFLFSYEKDRSFPLLASAFGTQCPEALEESDAVTLLFCVKDGGTCLCFRSQDGSAYVCTTEVNMTALEELCGSFSGNSCYYAYENTLLSGLPPYTLIDESITQKADAVSSGAVTTDAELDQLYAAMEVSSRTGSNFTESDGTRVIVSGNATLRLNGCDVTYRRKVTSTGTITETQAVEETLSRAEEIFLGTVTAASFYVADTEQNPSDGTWTVTLLYLVDGSPVALAGRECALSMTVGSAGISYMEGCLRLYSLTGESVPVIPMLQAAAAAGETGCAPVLTYFDDMTNMTPGWAAGDD